MKFTVRVKQAWWLRLYLGGLAVFSETFGLEPDLEKVGRMIAKGIQVSIKDAQ